MLDRRRRRARCEWFSEPILYVREAALTPDSCSILNGFDLDGRPILYLRPGRENQKTSPRQIRHLIFHLSVTPVTDFHAAALN